MTTPVIIRPWLTLRELHGLSQSAVSKRANINQSHYSHIERQQVNPSSLVIGKLLRVLPPPPRLSRNAIASSLEKIDPYDPKVLSLFTAVSELMPDWETTALAQIDVAPSPELSRQAQPGLVWLMLNGASEALPDDADDFWANDPPKKRLLMMWLSFLATIPELEREEILPEPGSTEPLPAADPQWHLIASSWPKLTNAQRSALANLVEVFINA